LQVVEYDNEKVMDAEQLRMAAAEKEQCRVDRFWGFEYEKAQQVRGGSLEPTADFLVQLAIELASPMIYIGCMARDISRAYALRPGV
jgi:hypothetical protein